MTENVQANNALNILSQRLDGESNFSTKSRQNWRLIFEKLYLEYKDNAYEKPDLSEHEKKGESQLDLNDQIVEDSNPVLTNKFVTNRLSDAPLPVGLKDTQAENQINMLDLKAVSDSKQVFSYTVQGLESRLNSTIVKQSQSVKETKLINTELFNNATDQEKTAVRLLKSEDGYHLVVRDSEVTKEVMQRLFLKVHSTLSHNNAKLSSVVVNGEELWRQGRRKNRGQAEFFDAVHFDKQY